MNRSKILKNIILFMPFLSCLALFSCTNSEMDDDFFLDIKGNEISSNIPIEIDYSNSKIRQTLDRVIKYTYTAPITDIDKKASHTVTIKYGIGDLFYNTIKKYENDVLLYDKTQELKLSIYRISYNDNSSFNIVRARYNDKEAYKDVDINQICKNDEIYTETNTLEYYFSESFKYGNKEFIDTITKDSLINYIDSNNPYQHRGILHYYFILEPLNDSDEVIKFGRIANSSGSSQVAKKDGYEVKIWESGDYVFPIDDITYQNNSYEVNYPLLEILPSSLNQSISYYIDGEDVKFYTGREEY